MEATVASGNKRTASDTTASLTSSRSGSNYLARGRVQRIYPERGFGFIRCSEGQKDDVGQDFFFHHSGLKDSVIAELEEGTLVEFEVRNTPKGKRAEEIRRAA
jgi:cold shock CspA family protein